MRTMIFGGLMAMAVGCGGITEPEAEIDLTSQKAPLPDCSSIPNSDLRNYYSNAAHTELVGQWGCYCGGLYVWGKSTTFMEYIQEC
ncbi:MAG: hypothetical protein EOO71_17685 [Myxococcaceae bacterium]|nr:MAG: hypothetical protein EOO71_17685 [Myxococcaceae bacterium]